MEAGQPGQAEVISKQIVVNYQLFQLGEHFESRQWPAMTRQQENCYDSKSGGPLLCRNKYFSRTVESMGLGLSGKWMTRISGAELPWHGEASFSGWQDEGWGSLVSSQDSKQKASEMRRAGWICQCLVPWGAQFRLTLTLHSQDKSLCHSSPSLPRHKFNLSSIIFTEEPEYTRNHRWNGRGTFFFFLPRKG